MKSNPLSRLAIALFASLLALPGCGTSTGNPLIDIQTGAYSAQNRWFKLLMPSAFASTSNIHLCFTRLRFKASSSDNSTSGGNIDFTPGEVILTTTGQDLGKLRIPAGTYQRVEFDLQPNCPGSTSGSSVTVTNANGTFNSPDTITIKFEGSFAAVQDNQILTLGFQAINDALNQVTSVSDIKAKLEAVSVAGSMH